MNEPDAAVVRTTEGVLIRVSGDWITARLSDVDDVLARLQWPDDYELTVSAAGLSRLDTGGALRLHQLLMRLDEEGRLVKFRDLPARYESLLGIVSRRYEGLDPEEEPHYETFYERLGKRIYSALDDAMGLVGFLGESTVACTKGLLAPHRIRWRTVVGVMEAAGVQALPIIGLLSFLLGVVIAYQGGVQLQQYGANIFIVELVSVTVMRELGPLITAIIVAGRTGSAYTAEIGTMKVTEEVDALTTLGIGPMEILVLPKIAGLVLVMPLLTLFSCAMGIFGGMVMADVVLNVELGMFLDRLPEAVDFGSFAVGIGKAPAFAIIIAVVGCFQGFQVSGGADAVGRQTTVSVVHSIFLVIVADAGFSIIFSIIGV